MTDLHLCELCGAIASVRVTNAASSAIGDHHYCAQHVPVDVNGVLEKEHRRRRLATDSIAKTVQEVLEKCEQREMDPALKSQALDVLGSLLRLCQRP